MSFPTLSVQIERWPIAGAFTISRGAKTEAAVVVAELVHGVDDDIQRHGRDRQGVHVARRQPDGVLDIIISEAKSVSMYQFGSKTAEFHICTRCGVVPVVTSLIGGRVYAVVSVNAFEGIDRALIRSSTADFDGEAQGDRLSRRQRNWITNVEYAGSEGP